MTDVLERLKPALSDRYTIQRELGRGGMATVYLARDLKHDREVAVKVLDPHLGAVLGGERFLREIRIAAGLNHPHILALHDSGEVDGLLYYVMPYVAGESLRQRLERQTQLSIDEAVDILGQVGRALDHAHHQGVVHRDIKPENILLQDREAVVADFGIARAVRVAGRDRLTETGLSLGTPAYMSPEQASGEQELDARSDVYSLGSVMYEMLAGEPPFTGPTSPAIIARQLVDPVPSLRTVRPAVPEGLERAIEKALAKVPADRYDNAGEFVAAADEAARVHAPPTREHRMLRRRSSHRSWRVGALVAVAVVIVAAGATLLLGWWSGRGEQQFTVANIRPVTRAPEVEWDPVISPDGDEVVYTAGFGRDMHLFVRDLEGGRALPLTADRPGTQVRPRWTADGRRIAFFDTGPETAEGRSYLIPRLGGPVRVLGSMVVGHIHGDRMAFIRSDSLLVRAVDGGEEMFVTEVQPDAHSVAWSPDGMTLAFVVGNGLWNQAENLGNVSPSAIQVVGMDDRQPVEVIDASGMNVSPAWMSDGRHLLFVSDREGPRDIYVQRLDGGRPRGPPVRLTTGLGAHSISVTADGSTVAYSAFRYRQNILQIDIPDTGSVSISQARPVTVANQRIETHGMSRDGEWLAFDSDLAGNQDIYLMPAEGGDPVRVTLDPGDDFHPDFSPDGREIVFYSNRHGTRDVFLISADGTDEVQLTEGPSEDYHPAFSPDGLRIVFTRQDATSNTLFVMSRDSVAGEWSPPTSMTREPRNRFSARWSPDGTMIATHLGGTTSSPPRSVNQQIWLLTTQGDERLLVDGPALGLVRAEFPDWSTDGRFVYFMAQGGPSDENPGGRLLYAVPKDGGPLREVVRFDDPTRTVLPFGYTVGDGTIFFSVKEIESDIFVMDVELN
jgi:serine/threonine-protein kinase